MVVAEEASTSSGDEQNNAQLTNLDSNLVRGVHQLSVSSGSDPDPKTDEEQEE